MLGQSSEPSNWKIWRNHYHKKFRVTLLDPHSDSQPLEHTSGKLPALAISHPFLDPAIMTRGTCLKAQNPRKIKVGQKWGSPREVLAAGRPLFLPPSLGRSLVFRGLKAEPKFQN